MKTFFAQFAFFAALLASLTSCTRTETVSTYPQGNPERVVTYRLFGPKDSLHIARIKLYFFNGNLESDAHYKRGQLHGEFKNLWHNGQWKSKGEYRLGKRQGHWDFYWNRFQLSSQGEYRDDQKVGLWLEYWENGELRRQGNYQMGQEIGLWNAFNMHGVPTWESSCYAANDTGHYQSLFAPGAEHETWSCRNGVAVGPYLARDPQGDTAAIGWRDSLGRKDSAWSAFQPGGALARREQWQHGQMHDSLGAWDSTGKVRERGYFQQGTGELVRYDTTGLVIERRQFVAGKREGEQHNYYPTGQIKSISNYLNDTLLESHTYYPNGQISSTGKFVHGKKEGDWLRYDQNGGLLEAAPWRDGVLEGEQRFYGPNGNVTSVLRYEHGYPAEGRFHGVPGIESPKLPGLNSKNQIPKAHFEVESR